MNDAVLRARPDPFAAARLQLFPLGGVVAVGQVGCWGVSGVVERQFQGGLSALMLCWVRTRGHPTRPGA